MMSNRSAVQRSKKLLASVALSILRYGGQAWVTALSTKSNLGKLDSTHRFMCLRVASAYRTVSGEVVWIIPGIRNAVNVAAS